MTAGPTSSHDAGGTANAHARTGPRRTLEGVTVRIERTETPNSTKMRRAFMLDKIQNDIRLEEIFRQTSDPTTGLPSDAKYEHADALWLVAYDPENQPIAIAGARIYGEDVYMGRGVLHSARQAFLFSACSGFIVTEWRGSGLIQELGNIRWQWASQRGATRSVFGTRWNMHAAIRFAERLGYQQFQPTGQEAYFISVPECWYERSITAGSFDAPKLPVYDHRN